MSMALSAKAIGLGAAALGGLWLFGSKPKTTSRQSGNGRNGANGASGSGTQSPGELPGSRGVPAELMTRVMGALASGDPDTMRAVADELRREGYPQQAADLEAAADQIEAARAAGEEDPTVVVPGDGTAAPQPTWDSIPLPGGGAIPIPTAWQDALPDAWQTDVPGEVTIPTDYVPPGAGAPELAGRVAANVATNTRETYDRDLVRAFQQAEGLKVDGKYGLRTGLAIERYDIVPPKPLYWGTAAGGYQSVVDQKSEWRTRMLARAMTDEAREDEWTAAAQV